MKEEAKPPLSSQASSADAASSSAKAPGGLLYKPHYLLLITTITIFVAEFLIMMVLPSLHSPTGFERAITDAILLSFIVFPSLYLFLLKPMKLHIAQRNQAEAEKDRLIGDLQHALDEVKTLRGIIPICAWCKSVRDDNGYWQQVEVYMQDHAHVEFSHGICPNCADKVEV